MPKRSPKGANISHLLPGELRMPGTTDDAKHPGLQGKWRRRMRERLVEHATEPDLGLEAHFKRAEERADAYIAELVAVTGRCGPIAETQLTLAAKFAELVEYLLANADPKTSEGRAQIFMAKACAETARMNSDGVLRLQHTIALHATPVMDDPIAKYLPATPTIADAEVDEPHDSMSLIDPGVQ